MSTGKPESTPDSDLSVDSTLPGVGESSGIVSQVRDLFQRAYLGDLFQKSPASSDRTQLAHLGTGSMSDITGGTRGARDANQLPLPNLGFFDSRQNDADNPNDFSPTRVAHAGDTLFRRREGDRLPTSPEQALRRDLKNAYGIDVSTRGGQQNYSFRADGRIHPVPLDLPLTQENLPRIREGLDAEVQERVREIEKRFGIAIRPPGEFVGNQENLCRANPDDKIPEDPNAPSAIRSRQPTLPELFALENALEATQPSQKTIDGKPLVVTFADKAPLLDRRGESQGHLASYAPSEGPNKPAQLLIYPSAANSPPTDRDARGRPEGSLAYTIRHEIGHNQQQNVFPDGKLPVGILNQLGFIQFPNPKFPGAGQEPFNYAVATRDGRFFTRMPPNCNDAAGNWYQVNKDGNPLSRTGQRVSDPRQAAKIKEEALDGLLTVRPPTQYYDTPWEVLSEGFAAYTGSPEKRNELRIRHPEVYKAVQTLERLQKEALERRR